MGLSYDYTNGEKACKSGPLTVRLDNRICGEIRQVKDGYQYFPKGSKVGGPILRTVSAIQSSLVADQPKKADRAVEAPESEDEQSAGIIKKIKKELKEVRTRLTLAESLVTASFDLLELQVQNENIINVLEENISLAGVETDGHSVHEELAKYMADM